MTTFSNFGALFTPHAVSRHWTLRLRCPAVLFLVLSAFLQVTSGGLEEGSYSREYGVYIGRLRAYSQGIGGQVRPAICLPYPTGP